jgi:hypothetical protein
MQPAAATLPPELTAHYRRVRRRAGVGGWVFAAFLRIFILPHTLVGIGLLFAMPASILWAVAGHDHVGAVERLWVTTHKRTQSYHVEYVYDLPADGPLAGPRRCSQTTVNRSVYDTLNSLPRGQRTVHVRALGVPPLFYDDVIDGRGGAWRVVGFTWLFGTFWCGIVSLFAYAIYVSPWLTRRLYRSGTAVRGTIASKRMTYGKTVTRLVTFRFQTPDGRTHTGEMACAGSVAEWDAAGAGDPVTVLYDPRRPKRSIAYEFGPYRCATA